MDLSILVVLIVVFALVFDLTNGWNGRPAAGEAVFVVTHEPPTDWPFPDAPFTFVTDGVASAANSLSVYAFDPDDRIVHIDVYLQMPLPRAFLPAIYQDVRLSD